MTYRIGNITAFLAIGDDDEEGICACTMPNGVMMPMIASDEDRIVQLRPMAEQVARATGASIYEVQFARMTGVEASRTAALRPAEVLADQILDGHLQDARRTIRQSPDRDVLAIRVTAALTYRGEMTANDALIRMESLLGSDVGGRNDR